MENPYKQLRQEMDKADQAKAPFHKLSDEALCPVVIRNVASLPTERLRALMQRKAQSPRLKDQYEARELAFILFAQAELAKLPDTLSIDDGLMMLLEVMREISERQPQQ